MPFDAKSFLKNLTPRPGVYQMHNAAGEVLYVGKASNLKNRVSSYFNKQSVGIKTKTLVEQIAHIQISVTPNDSEAFLLENSLIKQYKPKYNILLRDDKSYPYIVVNMDDPFPRMEFYRGKRRRKKGLYFGPYPSASAVKETLTLLQKLFKIRSCSPSFFSSRSRPCLQYQIKRCSAPCVNLIASQDYHIAIQSAVQFLQGKNQSLLIDLEKRMEDASQHLQFERAAVYRDQIMSLQQIQAKKQTLSETDDIDILGITFEQDAACVHKMPVRGGELQGGQSFFPHLPDIDNINMGSILEAFITQYYFAADHHSEIPGLIITSETLINQDNLAIVLSQLRGKKCVITHAVRGVRAAWLKQTLQNSEIALQHHLGSHSTLRQRFQALQMALDLPTLPDYLECFDISHTGGEATVASCVVFDQQGPKKSQYRLFNIHDITPGDDYAAMRQAIFRRYQHLKKEHALFPDILFIDGGKGQVNQALDALAELHITEIRCIGIAKGPSRKPGLETLVLTNTDTQTHITLESDSPALHLIQHIRDESHRFAVSGHTHQRDKKRTHSLLETIEGIGAKRRQALYRRFGGLQEVTRAGIEELSRVPGISKALAEKIYQALH